VRTPPQASGRGGEVVLCVFCPEEVALLAGEGDTAVLFSLGGAGEKDIRKDCPFEG